MLYGQSKQYLLEKLTEAGLKSRPYTALKALQKSQESHVGAVLFEREAYARNGSKKRFRDEEGAKHKRRKISLWNCPAWACPGRLTSRTNGQERKASNPAEILIISTFFYCLYPVYQAAKGGKGAETPCRLFFFTLISRRKRNKKV